jgi:hypothetical protein
MKHTNLTTTFAAAFAALTISAMPLFAADTIETKWNQVCRVADGRELIVTTANGDTIQGYCISVDVDGVGVRTKTGQITHIARTTLARLQIHRSKGNNLGSLGKGVHNGLKYGFDSLFSPEALLGAIAIPATLGWGAVSTPFCILGDLRDKLTGTQEIRII